ncbi:tape measure protein [Alkalibacterium psychrotolerans]
MSDGKISIAIEVNGKQVEAGSDALRGLEKDAGRAGEGAKKTERGIKDLVVSLGLVKLGAAAFKILASSMDTAIKRFDTMNQFPRVMEQVGFSTEESTAAIERLRDGVTGLPTPLQDVVTTARGIATMTKDLDGAVDTTLALNNAFLASGSSTGEAERGLQQYLQMLSKGEVDLQSWRTLQTTMGTALNEVAESFGFAGEAAQNDLYDALKSGDITFRQFNNRMIEMDQAVGGFAERALTGSEGIQTSWANIRTAIANGVAGTIDNFDQLSEKFTGKNIAQNLNSLKDVVSSAFSMFNTAINSSIPYIEMFYVGVQNALPVVKFLTPAIVSLATAYVALTAINKARTAIEANRVAMESASVVMAKITALTKAKTAAELASSSTTAGYIAANLASTSVLTAKNVVLGVITGNLKLATAAVLLKTKAVAAMNAMMLLTPFGAFVVAAGATVAVLATLNKIFNKATEEGKRLATETEQLAEVNGDLSSSIEDSSGSYERQLKSMESYAAGTDDLVERITKLSEQENKSAADKEMLAGYVEQLNGRIEGLGLSYSDEADMMSLSNEQIRARVDLMKEEEAGIAAQERLTEIAEERDQIEQQLAETNKLREEWNQKLEEGTVKGKEHSAAMEELNETQGALEERQQTLRGEYEATEEQLTVAMENISAATEDSVGKQTILFSELSEAQQQTVEGMKASWEDYKAAATDMFDTLNEEAEITASEMAKNLEENQRIITEWSENIATLAERGVDEGLLETLRAAGPESAGHVNALVNASDEELERLSSAFSEGGNVATDALSKSLGIEESGVLDAVGHLVTDTESALSDQIKSADFEGLGGNVAEGLAGGISQQSIEAEKASERMGEDVRDATKATLGINSPSTVFKEFGVNIAEGLALGINDGTSKVIQAIEKMLQNIQTDSARNFQNITKDYDRSVKEIERSLKQLPPVVQNAMKQMFDRLRTGSTQQVRLMATTSTQLVTPFNSTPARFRSIGVSAMSGLNAGLLSGRARVINTANNIAASVASTMQRALRINSPSKVMKDDVGRWIPEGIADGIEDKAQVVYDALNKMTGNMMKVTTPELALGTSRMASSPSVIQSAPVSQSKTIRNDNGVTLHIEKIENHSDSDIPRILEQAAWIMDRERRGNMDR